jgi:hypothetical protein
MVAGDLFWRPLRRFQDIKIQLNLKVCGLVNAFPFGGDREISVDIDLRSVR